MKKVLLLLLVFILVLACNKKNKESGFISFDNTSKQFDEIFIHIKDYNIPSDIAEGVQILNINKLIEKADNEFIIEDPYTSNLLLVNSNGKLLKQVGRKGKGPGEFTGISDFIYSSDKLYAINLGKNSIVVYDSSLSYLKDYRLSFLHRFSLQILRNPESEGFILEGNRNLTDGSDAKNYGFLPFKENTFLNLYDKNFEYKKSFLKPDEKFVNTNGLFARAQGAPFAPMCIVDNKIVATTEEGIYLLYIFDSEGKQLKKYNVEESSFKEIDFNAFANLKFNNKMPNISPEEIGKILAGHSSPISIYNINGYLIVTILDSYDNYFPSYQNKNIEKSYHIDIFKYENGNIKPIFGGIKTSKKIIGISENGNIYFTEAKQIENIKNIKIEKFRLNL